MERFLASPQYGERWGRQWLEDLKTLNTSLEGLIAPFRRQAIEENLAKLEEPLRKDLLKAVDTKEKDRSEAMKSLLKTNEKLRDLCEMTDQPSAALVLDLKQRGLLDDTIVLWTGEFGRLPVSQGKDGRDHNRHGFSLWLAGGGFKKVYIHGATDDFGYRSVQDVLRVYDLHATLLHALGLDHRRLTYRMRDAMTVSRTQW